MDFSSRAHDSTDLAEYAHRLQPAPEVALRDDGIEELVGIRHAPSVPSLELELPWNGPKLSGERDDTGRPDLPAHVAFAHTAPRLLSHPTVPPIVGQVTTPA